MKSCITVSLVPEARGGPFVFWDDLAGSCRAAAELGFDAIELFPPAAEAIDPAATGPIAAQLQPESGRGRHRSRLGPAAFDADRRQGRSA